MVAAASAGHIFNQPQAEHYANVADNYQLAVEYQQHGIQDGQSNYAHDLAYQRQSADKNAKILAYQSDHNGHSYHYAYETENGKLSLKNNFIYVEGRIQLNLICVSQRMV